MFQCCLYFDDLTEIIFFIRVLNTFRELAEGTNLCSSHLPEILFVRCEVWLLLVITDVDVQDCVPVYYALDKRFCNLFALFLIIEHVGTVLMVILF